MKRTRENFTLDDLQSLVRADEGGCLLWVGAASDGKRPMIWIDGASVSARRVIYELARGPIPEGYRIGVKCRKELCVCPDCLVARTTSQSLRGINRDEAFRRKISATKRAASSLTPEIVAEIRCSPLNNVHLGRQLGMPHQTIAKIRHQEIWKDYTSPFAGLGARKTSRVGARA